MIKLTSSFRQHHQTTMCALYFAPFHTIPDRIFLHKSPICGVFFSFFVFFFQAYTAALELESEAALRRVRCAQGAER